MKLLKSKVSALLLLLVMTVSFTACEDDDFWAEENFIGTWRVAYISVEPGSTCPYDVSDIMTFYDDRTFYFAGGYSLREYGSWGIRNGELLLDFNGSSQIYAQIASETTYDYIVLYVDDPYYGYYTLHMTRQSY